jgi:protein involved in temperature-dependent protein secretion
VITALDKYQEVIRELMMRRQVYPGQIAKGKLTPPQAKRQIDIMVAIALDYSKQAQEQGELLL